MSPPAPAVAQAAAQAGAQPSALVTGQPPGDTHQQALSQGTGVWGPEAAASQMAEDRKRSHDAMTAGE